jgi:hypothetical protein
MATVAGSSYCTVVAGLVPAIHVLGKKVGKSWMPGSSPGMTEKGIGAREALYSTPIVVRS